MINKPLRIAVLIHDIQSEYSRDINKSFSQLTKTESVVFYFFTVRARNWPYGLFAYQYWAGQTLITPQNFDALIIMTATQCNYISTEDFIKYLKPFKSIPMISIGVELKGITSVITDGAIGLSKLVTHLVKDHNCKKFAIMGVQSESPEVKNRTETVYKALKDNGVDSSSIRIFYGNYSYIAAYNILKTTYIKEKVHFDAIIALNDDMAQGCISVLKEEGISVPNDTIVTGFDNTILSAISNPSLTTVSQEFQQQISTAFDLIKKSINNIELPPLVTLSSRAIFRKSCGCICENFNENSSTNLLTESSAMRNQINTFRNFDEQIHPETTLEQLASHLQYEFGSFAIPTFVLCLYEQPIYSSAETNFILPQKARLYAAKDKNVENGKYFFSTNTYFNPHNTIVPPPFLEHHSGNLIVIPVFQSTLQYGYIVFESGNFDPIIYEMFVSTLSRVISSAALITQKLEENTRLHEQNRKLTRKNIDLGVLSSTDEMTKVLNRRGFLSNGQQLINFSALTGHNGLVIFGDMDGLKKINDNFGHDSGDIAITAEATILKEVFTSPCILGRLGGDEFVVVDPTHGISDIKEIEETIKQKCNDWAVKTKSKFTLSISLGVTEFSSAHSNLQELLSLADVKLYEIKQQKKTYNPQKSRL